MKDIFGNEMNMPEFNPPSMNTMLGLEEGEADEKTTKTNEEIVNQFDALVEQFKQKKLDRDEVYQKEISIMCNEFKYEVEKLK